MLRDNKTGCSGFHGVGSSIQREIAGGRATGPRNARQGTRNMSDRRTIPMSQVWLLGVAAAFAVCGLNVTADEPAAPEILPSGLTPEQVEEKPYREYVRECLDMLIQHGTDRYGPIQSPILVTILDVRVLDCPSDPLPLDEAWRVTRRERRGPAGANLYLDQATIRAMMALSQVTGDLRYRKAAEAYLRWSLQHLVDEKGLFWWGWHRHYDVYRDTMTGHLGDYHEIHIQQAIWPILWEVDSQAVRRGIEAIWQWHVIDKTTGECNRHGDGVRGCDFAMTGGEILYAFAFLYSKTKEPLWMERARLVANYYWNARNPTTQLIPNRPNAGMERFDGSHFDTSITAFLCHRLLVAGRLTGEPEFTRQAVTYLKAYGKYGYDEQAGRFWGSLRLDGTPVMGPRVRGDYAQYEPRGHIDLWQPYAAGYEHPIATAQSYALAAELTGDEELLETARRWADFIRANSPPSRCESDTWYAEYSAGWAPHGTYAELYGRTISFLLHLASETGQEEYRQFAREVAREAVSKLYYKGLFRGHPCKPYYEAIDGVGYLLYALLQLDQVLNPIPHVSLSWENM